MSYSDYRIFHWQGKSVVFCTNDAAIWGQFNKTFTLAVPLQLHMHAEKLIVTTNIVRSLY